MRKYSAEQSFIDLFFRMALHEAERRNTVGERANQGAVVEVYVRMDKRLNSNLSSKRISNFFCGAIGSP